MDETELRLRELELRERQLAFEREKWLLSQDEQQAPKTGWLKALGAGALAALAPAIGVFLDIQQADQQEFDTRLTNLREGYAFYFGLRQSLKESGDAADVEAVARTMSTAFPEAFCGIRPDLHGIALGKGSSPEENADLVWGILALDTLRERVERPGLFATRFLPWRRTEERVVRCEPIAVTGSAAPRLVPGTAAAEAAVEAGDAAPLPDLAPAGRAYTLYLHLSAGRDPATLSAERPFLAERGYRLAPGADVMPFGFRRAQVTFYDENQRGDADALAAWLSARFAADGLQFRVQRATRGALQEGILEVWTPAPPEQPAASAAAAEPTEGSAATKRPG